jgi:Ni/Co efflux regulator RcnB
MKLVVKSVVSALTALAFVAAPLTFSSVASAKTSTQVKNEKKGAAAKAKTVAKSNASKAKSASKKKK